MLELKPCIALKGEWRVLCNGQEVKRGRKFDCQMFIESMVEKYNNLTNLKLPLNIS
jgi:hypothetical protein